MYSVAFTAKRAFWAVYLGLTLILFPLPSYALTVQQVPNPRTYYDGWVTDMAQILSPDTEAKLNQIISNLEHQTGGEIAIVTVPETTPAPSPKAFTTELFKYWGIGKKVKNNGVLFLVSKSERRVEIETGYGIEAIMSDEMLSYIIQKEILPLFKQGNFDGGLLAGTKALVAYLDRYLSASKQDIAKFDARSQSVDFNPDQQLAALVFTFIIFFVALILAAALFAIGSNHGRSSSSYSRPSSSDSGWSSWDSGGGDSSAGSTDFGGGDSGGGGAGGDW